MENTPSLDNHGDGEGSMFKGSVEVKEPLGDGV